MLTASRLATNASTTQEPVSKESPASWIVVFPGARDSYQAPVALSEAGMLNSFVTDFYSPLDKPIASAAIKLLPATVRTKFHSRFHSALPSASVRSHLGYAAASWHDPEGWFKYSDRLGGFAGQLAAKNGCGVLAYSHVATSAFEQAPNSAKVLFQIQPHPVSVRHALAADQFLPQFDCKRSDELRWPAEIFETYAREPLLADFCIVPSGYTRDTLIANGVEASRISVVHYGVDPDFFTPSDAMAEKFTVLFVGQLVRQKGLHYLLEAWQKLKLPSAHLRIVGRSISGSAGMAKYTSVASFVGQLDWNALRIEYRHADLLCLPSLSEGFGLVALEAMACGTPVLTTSACGVADLIQHEMNGFVIPPADLDALMSRLEWAVRNRETLRQMRVDARSLAEAHSWARFRKRLIEALI